MILKKIIFHSVLILVPFLMLEGVFRLLPVSHPPYMLSVSSENPVARFQPDVDYLFSKGWDFSITTRKRSNNFGYINVSDYDPNESDPLLMVIGDSYVEAHAVAAGKSAAEILNAAVDARGRVYSVGVSGAPLSQYLAFAEFARTTFRPDAMVFVIVANDFDESLLKYGSGLPFEYFEEDGDQFKLRRVDYELSVPKKILRHSAMVRYIMLNLEVRGILNRLAAASSGDSQRYAGNVPASVEEARVADSMRAIDEYFRQLPFRTGLDTHSVLFVLDGVRPALYSPQELLKAEDSFASRLRRYFMTQAASRGYEVIDMQPVFMEKHSLDNSRFEFATDAHWNELGHELVASEIRKSAVFTRIFQ